MFEWSNNISVSLIWLWYLLFTSKKETKMKVITNEQIKDFAEKEKAKFGSSVEMKKDNIKIDVVQMPAFPPFPEYPNK